MDIKRRLRVVQKTWETEDTATFVLEPADGAPYAYAPGQYLSVIFGEGPKEQRRAYSFSSAPGVDALPAITVRRVANGEFSNQLLRRVEPGDTLTATEPAGRFVLPDELPATLVFLAAGSGITPIISQIKAALHDPAAATTRIVLYYANRTPQNTIFKPLIDRLLNEHADRFRGTYFFSREKDVPGSRFGHLNNALFEQLIRDYFGSALPSGARRSALYYLCAPNALMRMGEMTLRVLGIPPENIRKETFLPDLRLPLRTPDPSRTHTITVEDPDGARRAFEVYHGETILNGALRQGIALPYSCKSGVCFSCLARCRRGAVEVTFVQATMRVEAGSLVNTCIGYAVSEEVELVYEKK